MRPTDKPDYWYRAEIRQYCGCVILEFGGEEYYSTPPQVVITRYPVLKHTPKGVWLDVGLGERRFVLLSVRRRFACPTKEEALQSLVARKEAHRRHLTNNLQQVEHQLAVARQELEKEQHAGRKERDPVLHTGSA